MTETEKTVIQLCRKAKKLMALEMDQMNKGCRMPDGRYDAVMSVEAYACKVAEEILPEETLNGRYRKLFA